MWIRLGSFAVVAGKLEELRNTYNRDCAPIVRAAAGNLDCYLMESADDPERCVVCTIWQSEAAAIAYDASGTAQAIVGRVRAFFAGPPTLASYRVERAV
jgi:quinol monooxygenase YgiN